MARFWVYIGDKVQGPVDIPSLRKVPGFNLLSQVCEEGAETWRMADEVIEIKSYFISPPRPNSFALDSGNAVPKLELSSKPVLEELILPEPNMAWQKTSALPKSGDSEITLPPSTQGAPGAALRALCDVCGYKNPRDVTVCMKCGETLKGGAALPVSSSPNVAVGDPLKKLDGFSPTTAGMTKETAPIPTPVSVAAVPSGVDPASNTMIEISMSKLLVGCAAVAVLIGGSLGGFRSWKKHHVAKTRVVAAPAPPMPASSKASSRKPSSHRSRPVGRHYYPGYAPSPYSKTEATKTEEAETEETTAQAANPEETKMEPAAYRVVSEATPLKKRFSSPINSPYAVKRRSNQALWTAQEDQAIQQVKRSRIYGGQRTIDRNVEILMQILRDREYNTAFESGRRIYLYNDLDWSAVLKEGPVYEVRLTFSGGRETDGSPKKPLHFAFSSDLERGTVEPGGEDQVRSNTLHAFFDESRIAPEERRAIAKDTEELVLAAQPEASPLALDTVVRQFAKVYTTAALSRVAEAYDLTLIKKKLAHDTRLGTDDPVPASASASVPVSKTKTAAEPLLFGGQAVKPTGYGDASPERRPSDNAKSAMPFTAKKNGEVDFRMETGSGRERTFMVRAASRASIGKIWEVLTGYDRLKQFVPDMLTSDREGQDGAATIVHAVYLTRFMVFMFKINLHLRIIEHPREHTLEFERIAGEFESFRGSVELSTDPATHDTLIAFHANVVPSGHMMNWTLESMARRLLIPQVEAIRAKAESN